MYAQTYELYHHGILGQKWGVRRYQNEDGTRTAAGKKRYSDTPVTPNSTRKDFDARNPRDMSKKEMDLAADYYNKYGLYLQNKHKLKELEAPPAVKAMKKGAKFLGKEAGNIANATRQDFINGMVKGLAGVTVTALGTAFATKFVQSGGFQKVASAIKEGAGNAKNLAKNAASAVGSVATKMVPRNYFDVLHHSASVIRYGGSMNTILIHHGIQGQKWGVRRYQNEDGSLTSEGAKRYASDSQKSLNSHAAKVAKNRSESERIGRDIDKMKSRLEKTTNEKSQKKLEYSIDDYSKTKEKLDKNVKDGEKAIKSLTKELKNKGFNVTSSDSTYYKINRHDDIHKFIVQSILFGPGIGGILLAKRHGDANNRVAGTSYKVG